MQFWDHVGNKIDAFTILKNLGLWPEHGVPNGDSPGWKYIPATRPLTPIENKIDRLMREKPKGV